MWMVTVESASKVIFNLQSGAKFRCIIMLDFFLDWALTNNKALAVF